MTHIKCHWTSWCSHPVTCFSFEIPSLKWQNPICDWRTENQKSISGAVRTLRHHCTSWSQKNLCRWWRGSGVRKFEGLVRAQSLQNGLSTPFKWCVPASLKYALTFLGSTLQWIAASLASVVDAVHGSCWKASPKCLISAMVMGDAFAPTHDTSLSSGVSAMNPTRGV